MDMETETKDRAGRRSRGSRRAAPTLRLGRSPLVLIALAATLFPLVVTPAAAVTIFSPLSPAPVDVGAVPGLDIRTGISDDGNVVVYGYFEPTHIGYVAKIGETAIQLQDCPRSGDTSAVRGISGDGLVSVGVGPCSSGGGAFEALHADLTAAPEPDLTSGTPNPNPPPNGLVSYNVERMGGLLNDTNSQAQAASTDGNVIVGFSGAVGPTTLAFRWEPDDVNDPFATPGVMTSLGTLPGDARSKAEDVSGDGLTVVGTSGILSLRTEATVWTVGTELVIRGLEDLKHTLNPNDLSEIISHAFGLSDDGLVVGSSASAGIAAGQEQATLWNLAMPNGAAGFAVGLGALDDSMVSVSLAISFLDGATVVVGRSANDAVEGGHEAFIWTEATGMLSLQSLLAQQGVAGLDGWVLSEASAISIDQGSGLAISGFRTSISNGKTQAWVVRGITQVPEPGSGVMLGAGLALLGLLDRLRGRRTAASHDILDRGRCNSNAPDFVDV